MMTDERILYIEPQCMASHEPLIDELTRKMTAAFRLGTTKGPSYRGVHSCRCGAESSNCDYKLLNGEWTNSLCIHYLAYHRDEVPQSQLVKVAALDSGEIEPQEEELGPPIHYRLRIW